MDPMEAQKNGHKTFMDCKSIRVLGRNDLIEQVESYYTSINSSSPLVVVAEPGAGKSSLLAKCAKNAEEKLGNDSSKWRVFYHFVGAAPHSTNLVLLLKRLIKELNPESREKANDIDSLTLQSKNLLTGKKMSPCVLFIDAVNQLDEEHQQHLPRWLPETLSPNVKVIVSTVTDSASHKILQTYKPALKQILCAPLDDALKKEIVTGILKSYSKELDKQQMVTLIAKKGAINPLWLTIACEELKLNGTSINEKIKKLPEELIVLEKEVIGRFQDSQGGDLTKTALCLLKLSRHGLLETELLSLVGIINWAAVHRNLKPLLRPCGDLGEGRLNFYHSSFSQAVAEKYLVEDGMIKHYRGIIADFFEKSNDAGRKAEELPYHLELLSEEQRLRKCLLEWDVFNQLYNEEHSMDLLHYWQKGGGYKDAAKSYMDSLFALKESEISASDFCDQQTKVAFFLVQAGQYAESFRLMEECLTLELTVFRSSRLSNLGDLYGAMALCQSQFVNLRQDQASLEENIEGRQRIVDLCKKANKYRLQSGDPEQEYKTGTTNDLLCFQLTRIAQMKDNKDDPVYQEEANSVINQAMEVFTKFNMMGEVARCIQTAQPIKPFTKENFKEQKAGYLKAREMCLKAYGENHKLYSSITINTGNFFHANNMFDEAYDNYVACEKCRMNIMGPDHPYTLDIQRILRQEKYVTIREKREK